MALSSSTQSTIDPTLLALPSVFGTTSTSARLLAPGVTQLPQNLSQNPAWQQLQGAAANDLYSTEAQLTADQFAAQGDTAAQGAYAEAAGLASQNAGYAAQSTALQLTQAQRTEYQALGTETAGISGAGLQQSGSALDLLRSSVQQANLTNKTIQLQGTINENAYNEQAAAFTAQATAAGTGAAASTAAQGIATQAFNTSIGLLTQQAENIANPPVPNRVVYNGTGTPGVVPINTGIA